MKKDYVETPLMKQFYEIKAEHPDALLLFRVGDFYETFGQDAVFTAKVLNIVLTKRANGAASFVELAGFPHHALDTYLYKLVGAGAKVAICEQLEDPKLTKKIVKRGVIELITPGVAYNDKILEAKSNNFLASVHWENNFWGIAFLDVSTGEFYVAEGGMEYIGKLLQSFSPKEILIQRSKRFDFQHEFGESYYFSCFDDWVFKNDFARNLLKKHFNTTSLKGFGVEDMSFGVVAAAACLHYVLETKNDKVQHIRKLNRIIQDDYVWLDRFTIRNLELLSSNAEKAYSLVDVLDKTLSPMGARMLRRWISLPLTNLEKIKYRHDLLSYFIENEEVSSAVYETIDGIGDIERLLSKISVLKANPRDVESLLHCLCKIKTLKNRQGFAENKSFFDVLSQLDECKELITKIESTLIVDPAISPSKGRVIAEGLNEELDELRKIAFSGKDYLSSIVKNEIEVTGISSLKLGFNNVYGYYMEVTHVHKDKVPSSWIRKQTMTTAERYITEEIKQYEEKIITAEEKIIALESKIFMSLLNDILLCIEPLQNNASLLAFLDVILSFKELALENNYVRPRLDNSNTIILKQARHPVIEKHLAFDQKYIPNDLFLDDKTQQIMMITGPNMSGKSAYLRQTALIVLMAQMGSFVPAQSADIGLVDKIFTRVGASDNISSGESTFMVEMNETASILNNLSEKSLVLLDEIGRGTSTYDGISIAWAVAEYIHQYPGSPRVLFATHYHELNQMTEQYERIKNYHVRVKEIDNKFIFLRTLVQGGSEHSFGIHVAGMAGMPYAVLKKAEDILSAMEKNTTWVAPKNKKLEKKRNNPYQLSFISLDDPLLVQIKDEILNLDIDKLSPLEALVALNRIKNLLKPEKK